MKTLLWLDDVRNPADDKWRAYFPIAQPCDVHWVKSYNQFVNWITENGLPDAVCFDHDLADIAYNPMTQRESFAYHETTGYDCAKWLVEYCMDNELPLPEYAVQSANPTGAENIRMYLLNYLKVSN